LARPRSPRAPAGKLVAGKLLFGSGLQTKASGLNQHAAKVNISADTCDFMLFGSIIFPKVQQEVTMAWTTPVLVEICIGLEINGYLPAEF
jgi:coenzyme PQQ precursor peptide PqqA